MIPPLLAFLSTIAASVIHGGDYLRFKVVVMGLHLWAIAGALWLAGVTGYWLGAALPITAIYWLFYRRGQQADAEMNDMADIGKPVKTWQAYKLPCAVTAVIAAALFAIAKAWLLIPLAFLPFAFLWVPVLACEAFKYTGALYPPEAVDEPLRRKCRMRIEASVGAFPSGLAIGILVYAVGVYFGK